MGDDCENTQTQTQNSQIEWTQQNTPSFIPTIWGRLYSKKAFIRGKPCWKPNNPVYYDLVQPEFSLGRAINCNFVAKADVLNETIIRNFSKQHFVIKKDLSDPHLPAIITDLSYNGTFINGDKIGKGNCRVLGDNDVISVTHPLVKIFTYQDLLKNEADKVPEEITKKYYISKTLGQGACGIVKLVYDKVKCTKHAMKIIKKSRMTNGLINNLNDPQKIMNEINIMKSLRHPCIISIEQVYDSPDAVYMVLELMQGGELFDRITKPGHLTEQLTRFLFRQMVLAVKYLHSRGITHRDLKPENVLLESKDDKTLLKITDFGLSKFVGEDSFMKTMCGTPLYLAPEVLMSNGHRCYGPEVDVWSLGVIFFMCLVGYQPFSSDYKTMSLKDQIVRGKYRFSHHHWKDISFEAKVLMKRMLTVQVERRITLDQILNHTWMQDYDVIIRVEKLLSHRIITREMSQLTVSSNSTSDENNPDTVTSTITLVATKRGLSDSYNSFEPIAKKLCISDGKNDDVTSTTNSYCSDR